MNKVFFSIGIFLVISCSSHKNITIKNEIEQNDCNYINLIIKEDSGWFYNPTFNPKDSTYKNLLIEDTLKNYIGKDMCYFINYVGKNWLRSGPAMEYFDFRWYEFQYPNKINVSIYFENFALINPKKFNFRNEQNIKMLTKETIKEIKVISFGEIKKRIVIK